MLNLLQIARGPYPFALFFTGYNENKDFRNGALNRIRVNFCWENVIIPYLEFSYALKQEYIAPDFFQ
jgi:hypothetical protein